MVRTRVDSIDVLRGFVMVVMALDHVRGLWSTLDPVNIATTTPALFATRWITHLSARSHGEEAAWGMLFAISAAAIGASVGAVAGGVTVNTTTSKREGALAGACVGAATGAIGMVALSMKPGSSFDVSLLVGVAALGAVAGVAAGFSGSVVAKHARGVAQKRTRTAAPR